MENTNCYILEIINKILLLQRQEFDDELVSCDRPFLGPSISSNPYNTRPIQIYNRYTALPWSFTYTSGETTGDSNIFRIEDVEQNSVVLRLLGTDATTGDYINTNQFVTVDLSTIGAIRCFADTYITL